MRFGDAPLGVLHRIIEPQRGHLFPWIPVCFGCGVGLYFCLTFEPDWHIYLLCALCAVLSGAVAVRWPEGPGVLCAALCFVCLGFCHIGLRSHLVAAPLLEFRYYGPIEGRVIARDKSATDRTRITLDQVRLQRVDAPPKIVRLSLDGGAPRIGAQVMTTGHLMPPQGPVEPGGFDFRRHMWFQGIGASGYTRVPLVERQAPDHLWLQSVRADLSAYVRQSLSSRAGGVGAALAVGDRAFVPNAQTEALRASNLAHLLAISGLHMGLFAGTVFAALRLIFNLWPAVALRWPVKKIAAIAALGAGFGYLLLSGAGIATERAFVMVAVMLGAVFLDRQALSLRALSLAAIIVLLRRPESLLSPGFQMSFAATLALVVAFEKLRGVAWFWKLPGALRWGLGLFLSSAVAGAATAPFGAAHFNTISHFGLIANLLAVPVMGLLVAPAAVLCFALAPFGLDWIGFSVVDLGLTWILDVSETVASWPEATGHIQRPFAWVLGCLAFGGLLFALWQGRLRWSGGAFVLFALWGWFNSPRPHVLIERDGGLVGVMTEQGRALSRATGKRFVAQSWLSHDGAALTQAEAAVLWPNEVIAIGTSRLVVLQGKKDLAGKLSCAPDEIVVANLPVDLSGGCRIYDPVRLRETGAISLDATGAVTTVFDGTGARPWVRASRKDAQHSRMPSLD